MIIDAEPGPLKTAATTVSRVGTMCLVELQKLRHDRTELLTRAVQPALWLLVFGNVFTRLHAIPTGNVPYLDYPLAAGEWVAALVELSGAPVAPADDVSLSLDEREGAAKVVAVKVGDDEMVDLL